MGKSCRQKRQERKVFIKSLSNKDLVKAIHLFGATSDMSDSRKIERGDYLGDYERRFGYPKANRLMDKLGM